VITNFTPNSSASGWFDDEKFGFIILDGNGAVFGTLQGNAKEVLHKFTVDLPKKHGRGGQSALRFARLRMEKRHNYLRKTSEIATDLFIEKNKINVRGLIIGGSADFKTDLVQSNMFGVCLKEKIIKVVDISHGGELGFNQAIDLAADSLGSIKFIQETQLIKKYFEEISRNTEKFCYGVQDTLHALEMGAVETLICWEHLTIQRFVMKNKSNETEKILHLTPEEEADATSFIDKETGVKLEVEETTSLIDWLVEHYTEYGTNLEIITDSSQEGAQFVNGFGGIGGMLRYKVDFQCFQRDDGNNDEFDLDEY
jgi:peptide chain release factor subunit 1